MVCTAISPNAVTLRDTASGDRNMARDLPNHTEEAPRLDQPAAKGMPPRRLLVVDDNELSCKQLQTLLQADASLVVDFLVDGSKALKTLERENYSILLTDLCMPKLSGMDLIRQIQEQRLPVTVIVTTGHGTINEAVEAIRLGAYDCLTKPIDVDHLRLVMDRALRELALQDELALLRTELQSKYVFQNILSKNPKMHALFELISNVAQIGRAHA